MIHSKSMMHLMKNGKIFRSSADKKIGKQHKSDFVLLALVTCLPDGSKEDEKKNHANNQFRSKELLNKKTLSSTD